MIVPQLVWMVAAKDFPAVMLLAGSLRLGVLSRGAGAVLHSNPAGAAEPSTKVDDAQVDGADDFAAVGSVLQLLNRVAAATVATMATLRDVRMLASSPQTCRSPVAAPWNGSTCEG